VGTTANLLIIRHEQCSSLGLLAKAVKEQEIPFRYLDTAKGEILNEPLENYSHILILGGAISAYEDDDYPFLNYEFELLEMAIAKQILIVGICLGSQILARVLGANVYRGAAGREAGWHEVQLLNSAQTDPLFHDFPTEFRVFQSHQDTFDIPPKCVRLAESARYPNQAFRYQDHVWAVQFHLEFDQHVLSDCAAVIEQELRDSKIQDTIGQLLAEAKLHSPAIAPLSHLFMQQFLQRR